MKRLHLLIVMLFGCFLAYAQPVDLSDYSAPVKVACIGNSITYGSGIPDRPRDSWPAQLARMLGEKWDVRNFGVSGRTMLKKGDYPYRDEEAYDEVKAFMPDVVIIKLGTNDTKPQNWQHAAEFLSDYRDMVMELKALSSSPRIYLCKPVPVYATRWGINNSIMLKGVIPAVEQLAREENLQVIDLYTGLSEMPSLFPDDIHPGAEGAGHIALEVYKVLTGKSGELVNAQYPGVKSSWHGFTRYDFHFDRRNAHIVVPQKAAPGNPWVWRARFPEWHYQMDSILVRKGFHIVYVNTDGMFGSPRSVEVWDDFYNYLVSNYHLNPKVALEGVSRGGLFVFGFAKRWPERVSCIYAEAPVCDIKSWPGGKGRAPGHHESWQQLIEAYNFSGEEKAMAFNDNPVDNLEKLARSKVPLYFSIGLNDSIVPVDENTFILAERYISLGGPVTIYPNTKGWQNLNGHHFEIDDLHSGADFIINSYPHFKSPMNSSEYHTFRNGLPNAKQIFEMNKRGRVVFLGGSITANGGWRDSICACLKDRFPGTTFDFINAGIPSMGSTPGAFRFSRDVLAGGKVDLLFVEAAVNDRANRFPAEAQILGMEGIVRHAREANPAIDIVMMHFADPEKMADYNAGIVPEEIVSHEKVAAHYNIPTINLAREVTDRIGNGEFTWEDDFKDLHPSPFGQIIYYRSMREFLDNCWSRPIDADARVEGYFLPQMLNDASYSRGELIPAAGVKAASGWRADPGWVPADHAGTRADFVNVPMLIAENPGGILKFDFDGNAVGIAVAAGPDAGTIGYRIDRGEWKTQDLFTPWSAQLHLPWFYTLAHGLKRGKHRLEIRVLPDKNGQSTGNTCRIRYFYLNR